MLLYDYLSMKGRVCITDKTKSRFTNYISFKENVCEVFIISVKL